MTRPSLRRRLLAAISVLLLGARASPRGSGERLSTLYTFGDSILDCGRYNEYGVTPGALMIRNDDRLFPEFRGRCLRECRGSIPLEHRAVDGATVSGLPSQAAGVRPEDQAIALLTVGGNDLLRGLAADGGEGIRRFEEALDRFARTLPIRPLLIGNVYDPTFGDDSRNFIAVDARLARANHRRVNAAIAEVASRHGRLVDLHAHFLRGDPSWFTHVIEPSLTGASEVRRAFLAAV